MKKRKHRTNSKRILETKLPLIDPWKITGLNLVGFLVKSTVSTTTELATRQQINFATY